MASTPGSPPPDQPSAPPALAIVRSNASNLPRNLPVKRYDGDPLGRVDVQHALLCHLFSDTRRVFTNPRPGDRSTSVTASDSGAAPASPANVPAPVYPYGMSAGCVRHSDETEEEFKQWQENRDRYLRWKKRLAHKEKLERKAAAAAAAAESTEENANGDAGDDGNEERDELAEGGSEAEADAAKADEADADDDVEHLGDENEPLDEDEFPKPGAAKLTFKELYIESLLNSSKCTKSMRDKILADEEYAEDFAKVCLLVNVGRINTTLAFYPEMKTVLRSYHPLPSMQNNENTRRNMQDAPRMKSLLKGVLIDTERPAPPTAGPSAGQPVRAQKPNALSEEAPSDFREVIKRFRAGTVPPTSVVTLIFLLSLHASEVTDMHFPTPHDSHSLFYPHADHPLPSRQRANAFMWLLYHYLEGPATKPPGELPNPFDDETSLNTAKEAAEAYANIWTEEERKKRANQPWKGVVNPEWQKWKQSQEKDSTEKEADAKKEGVSGEGVKKEANKDGDVSMGDDGEKVVKKEGEKEPPSHLHRLLVPTLQTISHEEAAKENVDTEEEIRWGQQMQSERAAFLAKFQEEEAAKNSASAGSPAPSAGTWQGKGRKIGGASSAAASTAGGADRGSPSEADTSRNKRRNPGAAAGDVSKRSRMASPIDFDDPSSEPEAAESAIAAVSANPLTSDPYLNPNIAISDRIRPPLWDLDLSIPPQYQISHSLPRIAWARILDRAQRGVGDACYESDEDEFAESEAQEPEHSRSEICRILTGLQGVVRHDVFERDNHGVRLKYGGYEQSGEGEGANGDRERGYEGYRDRERARVELYSSSTPVASGRGGMYGEEEESGGRGRGEDVDDLEETLLGGDDGAKRRSVGRNGYTSVRA